MPDDANGLPTRSMVDDASVAGKITSAVHARGPLSDGIPELGELETVNPDRYEVGSEVARGGMGRIVEAWDRRHRRQVAIKMLLDARPDAARRFVREAHVTARLQHPAIVPLYEAGRWTSGEPFYAMKLVAGRSLATAIGEVGTFAGRLGLLPHLVAVSEALAYAHEQRIVHRDLKPSNVLVGQFGETVVIDWGLAKDLAAGGAEDGRIVGTPCYMAPEQARGDAIDERADVYAIGTMLYQLLSGVPPYAGGTSKETLARVLDGPPEPLDRIAPEVPADLATIVGKAMARDADARYPTAKELAADLRRFAAGQLVSAHSYSMAARVGRWLRKRRAPVAVALVLLAALAVVAGISVRRIVRERDRANDLARTAVTQRRAGEELVGFMVRDLRIQLKAVGRLDALAGVGTRVENYYRSVATSDDDLDVGALDTRATALETLGLVEQERKENTDAAVALDRRAIALRERILATDAGDIESYSSLAFDHVRLSGIAYERSDDAAGARELEAALVVAQSLRTRFPDEPRGAAVAGDILGRQAYAETYRVGGLASARDLQSRARALLAEAVAAQPDNAEWQAKLAWEHSSLGNILQQLGDYEGAETEYRACLALRERLAAADPTNAERQSDLGWGQRWLADVQRRRGDFPAALEGYRAALATGDALAKRDPENARWQLDLIMRYQGLENLYLGMGRIDDAIAVARAALAIADKLSQRTPNGRRERDDLSTTRSMLGDALVEGGQPKEAMALYEASLRGAESLTASNAGDARARHDLCEALIGMSHAQLVLANRDGALTSAQRAVETAGNAQDAQGDDALLVADAQLALGDARMARGEMEVAREAFAAAHDAYAKVAGRGEPSLETRMGEAESAGKLALATWRAGDRSPQAASSVDDAVKRLGALGEKGYLGVSRQALLKELRAVK